MTPQIVAVVDTSAVLALVQDEPGADAVLDAISQGAAMSTVNLAEFCAKLDERGVSHDDIRDAVDDLGVSLEPFLRVDAQTSGAWRSATRAMGLSLGDRACLALAHRFGVEALTADAAWADLGLGVRVRVLRDGANR